MAGFVANFAPERTFHRHRVAVADLFGIEIRCNRFDGNKYYIAKEDALAKPMNPNPSTM